MAFLLASESDVANTARSRLVIVLMIALTAVYLLVEFAFNHTLVQTLGSADLETDRITPAAVSGMTEMGRRLFATMVTLVLLGVFADNFVKDQRPFALPWFRWLYSKIFRLDWPYAKKPWGPLYFAIATISLTTCWFVVHEVEDRLFEFEEWHATAQRRQNVHMALNGTKLALAAAGVAAKNPGGLVQPVWLDVSDDCLVKSKRTDQAMRLDAAFLAKPGARPLIASLPHLLANRWADDSILEDDERCEVLQRWRSTLPSAEKTYATAVAPAIHSLEVAFDPLGPISTLGPGHWDEAELRVMLAPDKAFSGSANTMLSPLLPGCMAGRSRLDYRVATCLWRAGREEARTKGREAGAQYVKTYLDQRAEKIAEYESVIAAKESEGEGYAADFSKMEADERAKILPGLREKAAVNACIGGLDLLNQAVPKSLDGISSCADLDAKVTSLTKSAIRKRGCELNEGCTLKDWWYERKTMAAADFETKAKALCGEGAENVVANECSAAIAAAVSGRAAEERKRLNAVPLDPARGIRRMLDASLDDRIAGDPSQWPPEIRARMTMAANRLIRAAAAPDYRSAGLLVVAETDGLPPCNAPNDWVRSLLSERIEDYEKHEPLAAKINAAPWCAAYRAIVGSSGRLADEHQESLPKVREQVREGVTNALWQSGAASPSEAQWYAAKWLGDNWQPQGEADFAQTIEKGIIDDLVVPPTMAMLIGKAGLAFDDAQQLLDHPPDSFAALLETPGVNARLRTEANVILAGTFAYAGFSEPDTRHIGFHRPIRTQWLGGWKSDIYDPAITVIARNALNTRVIGERPDYINPGQALIGGYFGQLRDDKNGAGPRCYRAGKEAYYAALLPTLALSLSVAGLLLHSFKLTLFSLKLARLRALVRFPIALCVPSALIAMPIYDPPAIMREPLARNLLQTAAFPLPWMIAAQAKYAHPSEIAFALFADDEGGWDLSGLADPAEVAKQQAAVLRVDENDPRIRKLKENWAELAQKQASDPQFKKLREMLGNQFLCD